MRLGPCAIHRRSFKSVQAALARFETAPLFA
jgi:hypothetical protein